MLTQLTDQKLIDLTQTKVREEKKLTADIITYLQEISDRKLYVEYQVDSLHKFCVRILKYSDAEAALRIKAVRVAKKLPQIKEQIQNSSLSLNSVAILHNFMKDNPKRDAQTALSLIQGKSAREAEVILNKISDTPKARELNLKLNERLLQKLDLVRADLDNCDELEAIEILIDEKIRTLSAAKTKRKERGSKTQRYIPRSIKENINAKYRDKCSACGTGRFLEYDHIRPVALGGKSTPDNLRLLCRSCNQRQWMKIKQPSA